MNSVTEIEAEITNQYKSVRMGQLLMDHTYDGHDSSTDLFWCLTVIISADPQHHHLHTNRHKKPSTSSIMLQQLFLHLFLLVHFVLLKFERIRFFFFVNPLLKIKQ